MTSAGAATSWAAAELERLERLGLRRHPSVLGSGAEPEVVVDGRRAVLLCSNNYLGLAGDARVVRAAAEAAARWGVGSGASRLVSGTTELHRALEAGLAALKGCEDAVLFSSGYLANVGTIPALSGRGDVIFSDELNHASIVDGCRLSGARTEVYRHADPKDLDRRLATAPEQRRLVVSDTVFSMDGDLAPLRDLAEVCERRGALLMVDEAHATGVLGPGGGGAVEALGLRGRVPLVMGTLSKALGSSGGFVAGPRDLVELLRNRARTHVFDTAPGAPAVGAALRAVGIVGQQPELRARALELARRLHGSLAALGFDVREPAAAVVPLVVGDAGATVELAARLLERGVLAPAIRPPSVPPGTARLRLTVMATHTDAHLERAIEAFAALRPRGVARALAQPRDTPGSVPLPRGTPHSAVAPPGPPGPAVQPGRTEGGPAGAAQPFGTAGAAVAGRPPVEDRRADMAPDVHSCDRYAAGAQEGGPLRGRRGSDGAAQRTGIAGASPAAARRRGTAGGNTIDPRILAAGGVFVTGTDTGVGKTVVAAAIARALSEAGLRVGALKPVQTGTESGAGDAAFVVAAGGVDPQLARTPYRFRAPLAPVVAAGLEQAAIEPERILEEFRALRVLGDAAVVVVEGAGGLLVPLTGEVTMGGLAAGLGLPVVVVVRPGLGTINHTCLTVAAARGLGLTVCGLVISGFPAHPGPAEATNPALLERLTGVPLLGCVPVVPGLDVDAGRVGDGFSPPEWLGPPLGGRFDRRAFVGSLTLEVARVPGP